jgi:hypothetical protein
LLLLLLPPPIERGILRSKPTMDIHLDTGKRWLIRIWASIAARHSSALSLLSKASTNATCFVLRPPYEDEEDEAAP